MDFEGDKNVTQKPILMDFNLMKLIETTGNYMNSKSKILDRFDTKVANEGNLTQKFVRNLKKSEEIKLWEQDRQYLEVKQKLKQSKEIIEKLDEEDVLRLKKVLETTQKINQTYKKMNIIVCQQAQMLDRIDYNFGIAVVYTEKANKELKKLYDSYNNLALGIQFGLCLAIIVLSVLLFFKILNK